MTDPKLPELPGPAVPDGLQVARSCTIVGAFYTAAQVEKLHADWHAYARAAVELAGGGRDGERLDWLAAIGHPIQEVSYGDYMGHPDGPAQGLRAAIDAAMTGGEHGNNKGGNKNA